MTRVTPPLHVYFQVMVLNYVHGCAFLFYFLYLHGISDRSVLFRILLLIASLLDRTFLSLSRSPSRPNSLGVRSNHEWVT